MIALSHSSNEITPLFPYHTGPQNLIIKLIVHTVVMVTKLLPIVKEKAYEYMLKHPSESDQKVANQFGISRGFVYNLRCKFVRKLDYELAQKMAGAFLADFEHASDYFKLQTTELEKEKTKLLQLMEEGHKTIFKKNAEGQTYAETVDLDAMDKLQISRDIRDIMKQQTDLWKNVIFMARQGEALEIMKAIKDGRLRPDS